MSSFNTGLEGALNGVYSPADFEDADDLRPTAAIFDIGGNGSATPYTTAINGVIGKHVSEMRGKIANTLSLPATWKKRLRTFMNTKNTELLDFLQLTLQSHPTLGKGESILRKFGNVNMSPSHASIRDLVVDVSGADYMADINRMVEGLKTGAPLQDCISAVHMIFEQYREAGEKAIAQEAALKAKLDMLDKLQGKLAAVIDLDPTEKYEALLESTEAYVQTIFDKHQIKDAYRDFVEAYRRFITLRDVVLMMRTMQSNENEPICSVCISEQIVYAIVPCGHTCCSTCMLKQTGVCFFCRGAIRERQKLFF